MHKRGEPAKVAEACIPEIWNSTTVVGHIGWHTAPVSPTSGMRQGCSVSSVVIRWVMEDILEQVSAEWSGHNCGILVCGDWLQYICWADDSRLFAKSATGLSYMVRALEEAARRRKAGMELRLPKSPRPGQDFPQLRPSHDAFQLARHAGDPSGELHEGRGCTAATTRSTAR